MPNNTPNNPSYGMQYPQQHGNGDADQRARAGVQASPGGYAPYGQPAPAQMPLQGQMHASGRSGYAPMPQSQKPQKLKKEKRRRGAGFYVAIVIAVLALVAACVLGYFWWQSQQPSSRDNNAVIGQIEGKTDAEIQAELDRIIEEGMFNISIASEVTFENGEAEGALKIENSPANHYLMQVNITRNDTGDVIYQSGILDPNTHIQTAKLNQDLPAGTYECTALFNALDPETEDLIGSAAAVMEITVES